MKIPACSRLITSIPSLYAFCGPGPNNQADLQNEDEIVHRFVAVEEVMLKGLLILLIIFELLDDVGVLEETQKDLFRHLDWTKCFNFCKEKVT